jgi:hypothetical protein
MGLGQTLEKLKAICGAAKMPEGVTALKLFMEQEHALRQHATISMEELTM